MVCSGRKSPSAIRALKLGIRPWATNVWRSLGSIPSMPSTTTFLPAAESGKAAQSQPQAISSEAMPARVDGPPLPDPLLPPREERELEIGHFGTDSNLRSEEPDCSLLIGHCSLLIWKWGLVGLARMSGLIPSERQEVL